MKKVLGVIGAGVFAFTLFFNVSLTQSVDGDSALSLESLQTAKAYDEGGCITCILINNCYTETATGNTYCVNDELCWEHEC